MGSFSEHAEAIKAAIKAAESDGFELQSDIVRDHFGEIDRVDLDLMHGPRYITIFSEEW